MTHEMHKPHLRYAFSCILLTNCLTSTCTFCAQNFAYNVIPQGFVILLLSLFLLQFNSRENFAFVVEHKQ